jgi:diacylglycerol kinase (ATP)
MQLNLDGEFGGLLPGEFVNMYRHINVYMPKEKAQEIRDKEKELNMENELKDV